jgi:hypothetical protein
MLNRGFEGSEQAPRSKAALCCAGAPWCKIARWKDFVHDDALSVFVGVPRLFGIAYRTLGSAVEAEDIVQDV